MTIEQIKELRKTMIDKDISMKYWININYIRKNCWVYTYNTNPMTAKTYLEYLVSQLDKMENWLLWQEDNTMLMTVLDYHKLLDIK